MRNISLTNFESCRLSHLSNCQVFCHYRNSFYGYDKGIIVKYQQNTDQILCNLTVNLYPVDENDDTLKALQLTYFYEKDLLYLILLNGDIISLSVDNIDSESIVGSVEDGIKAIQWSPEQELVALVSSSDNVILMTNNFDPVAEVNLHGGGFGEKQTVNVGWGKKETQFRGSEGKFTVAKNEKEETIRDNSTSVKISWRGDGEYFAVSCINPEKNLRYLRIFNRNGVLQYTSEDITGLEGTLSWRPSGNLIASTQKLPNKYNVCFIEKNGLKHGDFALPLNHNKIRVIDLFWNKDSKLLALLITKIAETENNEAKIDAKIDAVKYVQIYTVNNYHWYCKYTINIDKKSSLLSIEWDNQKQNMLHAIVKRGGYVYHNKYTWVWGVNKSKGNTENDESFVAVIDGCDLKLTSFSRGIIPPPMSTYEVKMNLPINSVTFASDQDKVSPNDFLVQLSDNSLFVYKFLPANGKIAGHELAGEIEFDQNDHNILYNVQWMTSTKIICTAVKNDETISAPYLVVIDIEESEKLKKNFQKIEIPLQSTIALMTVGKDVIVTHNSDGKMYLFNQQTKELGTVFPSLTANLIELELIEKTNKNFYILGLDNLNKFYINERTVFNNILSFLVHKTFVLLTNMKHELLCFDIDDIDNVSNIYKRRVERGSRLITSIYKDMKVVMQMPRGNLECIQPRALSIKVLGEYLDTKKYFEAFDLMKKQRINFNLIIDHNPNSFSRNISTFVQQIKDPQLLCLFASELMEEDVTKTMYAPFYNQNRENIFLGENKSKIDFACELMENALLNTENSQKYVLPLLTCCIKRGKLEYLEAALLRLKELKEKENRGEIPLVSFDAALRYVLYLINVEDLYKIALGMYDFDLALMLANKSQMDPKEYLPFLNDLKKLEEYYQKFCIDKYLKRYKKALTNLVRCDGDKIFDECINFIKIHNLYKEALKIIPQDTDKYKTLCITYAEELMKQNLYEEAGIMYSNGGIFEKSIEAFKRSGNWEEALICVKHLKKSDDELFELYMDLATILFESKKFKEAATIYLDYLGDVSESIESLIAGKLFGEAYRICYLHNKTDLINSRIVPAILEYSNLMILQIDNFRDTFTKQKNRLLVVRKLKLEGELIKGEPEMESDLYSEAGSTITRSFAASNTTNRTYRSAKNKRKQERKLLSLKEGAPHEDLALINSLHNIIVNCLALKSEIRELNKQLLKINKFEIAENLQGELDKLLKTIESSKADIWVSNRQNYGAEATSNQLGEMFSRGESEMPFLSNPKIAFPPDTQTNLNWKLEILKT